jgi:hypothetical protein
MIIVIFVKAGSGFKVSPRINDKEELTSGFRDSRFVIVTHPRAGPALSSLYFTAPGIGSPPAWLRTILDAA